MIILLVLLIPFLPADPRGTIYFFYLLGAMSAVLWELLTRYRAAQDGRSYPLPNRDLLILWSGAGLLLWIIGWWSFRHSQDWQLALAAQRLLVADLCLFFAVLLSRRHRTLFLLSLWALVGLAAETHWGAGPNPVEQFWAKAPPWLVWQGGTMPTFTTLTAYNLYGVFPILLVGFALSQVVRQPKAGRRTVRYSRLMRLSRVAARGLIVLGNALLRMLLVLLSLSAWGLLLLNLQLSRDLKVMAVAAGSLSVLFILIFISWGRSIRKATYPFALHSLVLIAVLFLVGLGVSIWGATMPQSPVAEALRTSLQPVELEWPDTSVVRLLERGLPWGWGLGVSTVMLESSRSLGDWAHVLGGGYLRLTADLGFVVLPVAMLFIAIISVVMVQALRPFSRQPLEPERFATPFVAACLIGYWLTVLQDYDLHPLLNPAGWLLMGGLCLEISRKKDVILSSRPSLASLLKLSYGAVASGVGLILALALFSGVFKEMGQLRYGQAAKVLGSSPVEAPEDVDVALRWKAIHLLDAAHWWDGLAAEYPLAEAQQYLGLRDAVPEADKAAQLDNAEEALHAALALAPYRSDLYVLLSRAQLAQGQMEGAVKSLQDAVKYAPLEVQPRRDLAELYETYGYYTEAANEREVLVVLLPTSGEERMNLGRVWELAGSLPKALEAYRTAVEIDPNLQAAWQRYLYLSERGK